MPSFLTEYTHLDGSRWAGPTLHAETLEEAQASAMDYPVQPLVVLGELVDVIDVRPNPTREGVQ